MFKHINFSDRLLDLDMVSSGGLRAGDMPTLPPPKAPLVSPVEASVLTSPASNASFTATVQSFLSWQDELFAEGQIRPGNGFHTPGIDDKSAQASVFKRLKLVLAMEIAVVTTE